MPFEPGKSGNPNGRPSSATKDMTPAELKACLSKLKRYAPKAIDLMIEAMLNEEMGKATNLKYAEKIAQLLLQFSREADRKSGSADKPAEDDDEKEKAPVVQFSITRG